MVGVGTKSDKIKKITNPLTIIGMFAMLSETTVSVLATHVDKSIQGTFLWFVMGFPVLLLLLFFLTLNFNRIVFYAPGDFNDERNFYNALSCKHKVVDNIENVIELSNKTKNELVIKKEALSKYEFNQLIDQKFSSIESALKETKNSAEKIDINLNNTNGCKLEAKIINYLYNNPYSDMQSLSNNLKIMQSRVLSILRKLENKGVIISAFNNKSVTYRLNNISIKIKNHVESSNG